MKLANILNLINLIVPEPKISSIEDLNKDKNYRSKTRRFSYAIFLSLIFNVLGVIFYLKQYELREPIVYEVSIDALANQKEDDFHKKRLIIFNKPRHTEAAINRWVDIVLNDLYNFDFLNFVDRINHVEQYFTEAGYDNFITGLKNLNNGQDMYTLLKENKYTVNTIVFDKPLYPETFGKTKVSDGNLYYRVYVPMRMTIQKNNHIQEYDTTFDITLALLIDKNGKTGFFINHFEMSKPAPVNTNF